MLKSPAKPKATTKAKPAKLMDAKDASRIHKDMKASGAAQAKERAKETKKK